jgi:hypothetical protein
MRLITPSLTSELKVHCGTADVWRSPAFPITTFRGVVEHVASLHTSTVTNCCSSGDRIRTIRARLEERPFIQVFIERIL